MDVLIGKTLQGGKYTLETPINAPINTIIKPPPIVEIIFVIKEIKMALMILS